MVDEADDQFKENPPLRAVINSGWTRGAGVPRCDPDMNEPEIFSTFGPKAIGMKGRSIPDTTFSRSIVIEMVRKKPGERPADFEHLDDAGLKDLRRELARWAADNVDALAGARPTMPAGFQNRLAANWRPLLSVADLVGGDWPQLARAAAVALVPRDTSSIGTTLLGDIRSIFAEETDRPDRLPSSAIAEKLHGLEDRPWAEWGRNGKPISPNQIARLLRPFGIAPENIAIGGRRPKGYLLARFQEAFERYLDVPGVSEPLNRYSATAAGASNTFQTATEDARVAVQKCEKALGHSGSSGWAVQKVGDGKEREENGQTGALEDDPPEVRR